MRTVVLDGKAELSGAHEINLLGRKVLQVLVVRTHVNDIPILKLLGNCDISTRKKNNTELLVEDDRHRTLI